MSETMGSEQYWVGYVVRWIGVSHISQAKIEITNFEESHGFCHVMEMVGFVVHVPV